MARNPRTIRRQRSQQPVSAIVQGRRILLRGPVGHLRKTRPFLTDT